MPPLGLSVWVVRRVTLAGNANCLLVDGGGDKGVQVTSSESRAAIGSVRHHIEVDSVMVRGQATTQTH